MIKKRLSKEAIEQDFVGFIFTDCIIRCHDLIYLLARKDLTEDEASQLDDSEIPTVIYQLTEDEDEYLGLGGFSFENFTLPRLGVSYKPIEQGIIVSRDIDGSVLPVGGGKETWPFEYLQEAAYPDCSRLRSIDGYIWASCHRRQVFKRTAIGNWEYISNGFQPELSLFGELDDKDCGFNDIDGFSEQEIYAVGGKGDVWKYDGKQWSQCGFPTNDDLYTVCCGKDGFIYIGARNALWKGKDNEWQQVCEFDDSNIMKDLRWFDNKLWLAYDYSLLVWDGKKLQDKIIYNKEELSLGGRIDSSDDMLLVACPHSVWTFDGKDWYNIIPDFS